MCVSFTLCGSIRRAGACRTRGYIHLCVPSSCDQVANNSVFINVALVLWAFRLDEKPGQKIVRSTADHSRL